MDIQLEKKKGIQKKHIPYIAGGAVVILLLIWIIFGNHASTLRVDAASLNIADVTFGKFNDYIPSERTSSANLRRPIKSGRRRNRTGSIEKTGRFHKKRNQPCKIPPDGIRKNGTRCRVTEKTLPGDIIEILLETETQTSAHLAVNTEVLDILYEDQDLLAVNKPAGVVTHPQGGHYEDTLANQVSAYYAFRQESHTVRPIGRLDKDTSGIVLFAKNQTAAARLQKQRERGELQKTYLAVTEISVKWNDDNQKT